MNAKLHWHYISVWSIGSYIIIVHLTDVKHIQRKRNRQCYTEYKSNAPRFLIDYFYNGFGERDSYMRHCSAAMITPYGMCYWRSSSPSFSYGFLQTEFPAELYIEICPPSKSYIILTELRCTIHLYSQTRVNRGYTLIMNTH